MTTAGWYHAEGDPLQSQRYWDGQQWVGDPVFEPQAGTGPALAPTPPPVAGTPPPQSHSRFPAPSGTRMWGRVIDVLILFAFLMVLVTFDLGGRPDPLLVENSDFGFTLNGRSYDTSLEFVLFGLFTFVWTAGWIHLKGGTPGKLMLGMRIADETSGETPPNLQQSALRAANYLLPMLALVSLDLGGLAQLAGFLIGVVSLVLLFSDNKSRTVMDRVAKTVVVRS